MSETEQKLKQYFSDPGRFADVFNAFVFEPAEKISPEDLTETESETLLDGIGKESFPGLDPGKLILKRASPEGRIMDLSLYVMAEDGDIDLFLPVTVMTIETLLYQRQLRAWREDTKDLVLAPCAVLALYLGKTPWDAAEKLSSLCETAAAEWLRRNKKDVRVRLVTPFHAKRKELNALMTDVREILTSAKHAGSETKLRAFAAKNRAKLAAMDGCAKGVYEAITGIAADPEEKRI